MKDKTKENRFEKLEELRRAMGTLPEEQQAREDELFWGLQNLKVEMVDFPTNPYRAIYDMVTSTWGGRQQWWNRWENATPEGRIDVVKAVLSGQTLGQPRETPKMTFRIQGATRASFDQFARHRFAAIGSVGSRDNSHVDAALVVHPSLKKKWGKDIEKWWKLTKDIYCDIVESGQSNWQNARELADICRIHESSTGYPPVYLRQSPVDLDPFCRCTWNGGGQRLGTTKLFGICVASA